jgi:hypothetical protein
MQLANSTLTPNIAAKFDLKDVVAAFTLAASHVVNGGVIVCREGCGRCLPFCSQQPRTPAQLLSSRKRAPTGGS